jgi:hypothetical protein
MKKQLFLGALLLNAFFSLQAQTIFSFETAETFTTGPVSGQVYWSLYGDTPEDNAVITTDWASDGTQSLKLATSQSYFEDGTEYGAVSPLLSSIITASDYEISQVVKTDLVDASTGSNMYLYAYNYDADAATYTVVSVVYFNYDGTIYAYDATNDESIEIGTFVADEDYTITTRYTSAGTISFYVNGVYGASVTAANGTTTNLLVYTIDDWDSSYYVDNIVYNTELGVKTSLISNLSIYPNPATDVVNIASSETASLYGVQITDINGRVVKTVKYNGVESAQVNVSELANGVYIMSVTSDKGTSTQKIVKK